MLSLHQKIHLFSLLESSSPTCFLHEATLNRQRIFFSVGMSIVYFPFALIQLACSKIKHFKMQL